MSTPDAEAVTIPARVTARDLADAIGRDVSEVTAILTAREEPDGAEDVMSAELALLAAKVLGATVVVEPRDLALEYLYTYEALGEFTDRPDGRAGHLFNGVTSQIEQLDTQIEAASEHWSVARMPIVDRNILRIGLYELDQQRDTPTAVIIAEAVRLAQTYSTERSASFVNGVLAALATAIRG